MRKIITSAAAALSAVLLTGAVTVPAAAQAATGPATPAAAAAGHVYNEIPYFCIALASHGQGHRAAGAMCAGHRSQLWTVRGHRIVAASGLCLTARPDKQVITARCGRRHGQRWTLMTGEAALGSHRIESQRFGGRCLALPASYVGPVQLSPCDGPPVIDGGTGYWVLP